MKLLVIVAAVGCSSAPPVISATAPPRANEVPKIYAALFEGGRSWNLPAEVREGKQHSTGRIACRVRGAHDVPGGRRAELACTLDGVAWDLRDSPAGSYVGTGEGLSLVEGDRQRTVIAAGPRPAQPRYGDEVPYVETSTQRYRDAWCYGFMIHRPSHHAHWSLCVGERGIVGGNAQIESRGVTVRELRFGADLPSPSSSAPAALFAKMFEQGRTWRLPAEAIGVEDHGEGPVRTETFGTMTCGVTEELVLRGGKRARLACKLEVDDPSLVDTWSSQLVSAPFYATSAGLWAIPDVDMYDVTWLDPRTMLIGAPPRAGLGYDDGHQARVVKRHGDAWCFEASFDRHMVGWLLCLRDGEVVGGGTFQMGPLTRLTYFGDVPRER